MNEVAPKRRRIYLAISVLLLMGIGASGALTATHKISMSTILIPAITAGIAIGLLVMKINGWNQTPE